MVHDLMHETCVNEGLLTCLRVRRAVYLRSLPSRRKSGWGLSRIINTISEGIFPFVWSPSFWNVTFVPDFQPGFTDMLTYLSSFFGVPSGCSTRLEIFIFFTQPLLISSSVTYKSCSTGGSWVFSFLSGVWTLNECDLKSGKQFSNEARNMCTVGVLMSIAIIKFHFQLFFLKPNFDCMTITYLNAVPRPCGDLPKPKGDEKKSSSIPPIDENKLLWWSKMLSESKNELNGLLVPKNDSNVALGSPWNSYLKLPLLFDVPLDLSVNRTESFN